METTEIHSHADLEGLYTDAEQADSQIFAEMRSNLLLIAGEHYNRKESSYFRRIRDAKDLSEQQKLRLTKNHIQKIAKTYVNNIISMAPGVGFKPKNESELQDQKAAELHHSVWLDAKDRYRLDEKIDDWCDDFVGIGEVALKIFWDARAGKLKGHQQQWNPESGELFTNTDGTPVLGEAVYEGGFLFEQIHGFNLLRPAECKDMRDAEWLCLRKMVSKEKLIQQFPDKKSVIVESADSTMVVFDGGKGGYRKANSEVLVKEFYFRPCEKYPSGYFFYITKEGELTRGELPGGIFPVIVQQFDKIPTTPRGRSPVKTMRPYQAEINRAASKMAEHQITLGDDKLLIQNGTKVTPGMALPGVRAINYQGAQPIVVEGRAGEQYLNYLNSQVAEMYQVMNVAEDYEQVKGDLDPMTLLFRSASQKKRFQRYIRRFERFLVDVCKTYLALAKIHLPDDQVIMVVGRNEQVNISEFRNATDISYQIIVEPQSDDVETKLGKQIALNHALQYVGGKLEREDIGKIMRSMPYGNFEESFSDLTIEYDAATNTILALDRGEQPMIHAYDNNVYMLKRLVSRTRQADFKFLPPEFQQSYGMMIGQYQKAETDRQAAIQQAEAGFIPTGGYLVNCEIYVADPNKPDQTRRARIPYESLVWLIKKLETQGQSLDELEKMNQGAVAQMAQNLSQKTQQGPAPEGMGAEPAAG